MNDREARIDELFSRSLALDRAQREALLAVSRNGADADIVGEVEALLADHDRALADDFLARPLVEPIEASSTSRLVEGVSFERYTILGLLGEGGMGEVYLAQDQALDRKVAIKLIRSHQRTREARRRFSHEQRVLANLQHPNIAQLFEARTTADGLPFFVMEYVEGVAIDRYVDQQALSVPDRLRLFVKLCAAVSYAHRSLVVHRDIKPTNVLVTAGGQPKLLDFGIAKVVQDGDDQPELTGTLFRVMTPEFASPEQVRGDAITTSTDVYSLGVLLYTLLTGRSPYALTRRTTDEFARAVCDQTPERPSVVANRKELRGDLDTIVLRSLAKEPERRYASVEQLAGDIDRHLTGLPVMARQDSTGYRVAKFVRRNLALVAAGVALVLTLVGGITATAWSARRARLEAARAQRRFDQVRALAHAVIFDYHDAIQNLPGSTPVRQRLVKDALGYLDSLTADGDNPSLEREMVDAYVRISNVQGNSYFANLGDTAGAVTTATRAVSTADALLTRDQSTESLRSAALAYQALGGLLYAAGDLSGADVRFQGALRLHEQAAARPDADVMTLTEQVETLRQAGDLAGGEGVQNLGRTDLALTLYRKADELSRAAMARDASNHTVQRARYAALLSLAGAEASLGHLAEATAGYQAARATIEQLSAENPNDQSDSQEVSNVALRLGMLLMDQERFADAVEVIRRSRDIMAALVAGDPKNTLHQRNLSVIENHLSRALVGTGRTLEAVSHAERALAMAESLSTGNPSSVELAADVAISQRKLAEALSAAQRLDQAYSHATTSIARLEALSRQSPDAYLKAHLERAFTLRGTIAVARQTPSAALDDLSRAEDLASALSASDPRNAALLSDLARAQAARGTAHLALGQPVEADAARGRALAGWATLRDRGSLTPDDARRADELSAQLESGRNRLR